MGALLEKGSLRVLSKGAMKVLYRSLSGALGVRTAHYKG